MCVNLELRKELKYFACWLGRQVTWNWWGSSKCLCRRADFEILKDRLHEDGRNFFVLKCLKLNSVWPSGGEVELWRCLVLQSLQRVSKLRADQNDLGALLGWRWDMDGQPWYHCHDDFHRAASCHHVPPDSEAQRGLQEAGAAWWCHVTVMSCNFLWYFQSNEINMQHICVFFFGQTASRFHHCPPVLVLQLKRFQYTRWSWAQCQTHHLHLLFQVSSTPSVKLVKLSFQVSRTTQQPCRISVGEPGSQPLPDGAALSKSWRNGADHGHYVLRILSPPEIVRNGLCFPHAWPCCCHEWRDHGCCAAAAVEWALRLLDYFSFSEVLAAGCNMPTLAVYCFDFNTKLSAIRFLFILRGFPMLWPCFVHGFCQEWHPSCTPALVHGLFQRCSLTHTCFHLSRSLTLIGICSEKIHGESRASPRHAECTTIDRYWSFAVFRTKFTWILEAFSMCKTLCSWGVWSSCCFQAHWLPWWWPNPKPATCLPRAWHFVHLILLNQNRLVLFGKGHYVAFSRSSIDGASPNEFDLQVLRWVQLGWTSHLDQL